MANGLYDYGRNEFTKGNISWKAAGGSTIKTFLIDSATYTPDLAAHQFLSSVPAGARKGNTGGNTRADAPALTLADPVAGVCDASDIVFTAIPAGAALEYILLFRDDGVADASSPLIALIDTATGLPITPNGADITISWDNGANRIFKL